MKKTYQEMVKNMRVKNWEERRYSDGRRVLYVRYIPNEPSNKKN